MKEMIFLIEKNIKSQTSFLDARIPDCFPLAMAYIRVQPLEKMYPPETAIERGTLFPDLDKPFCGKTVCGGNRR